MNPRREEANFVEEVTNFPKVRDIKEMLVVGAGEVGGGGRRELKTFLFKFTTATLIL